MHRSRRRFLGNSMAMLLAGALPAWAAGPETEVNTLVFGVPPGAVGERLAGRTLAMLAAQYQANYELQIVPTHNTQDATRQVKIAPADGSTLLQVQSGSMVLFPSMYRKLDYDPLADFTPLGLLGAYDYALAVGPAVPASVRTVDQYLAWVQRNPDYRDLGFTLYGSQGHLGSLMLARIKEIALRPQAYHGPLAMFSDLRDGQLAAALVVSSNQKLLGGGSIRALAVSSAERLQAWPEVQTFAEQGLPELILDGWYGWFAPAALPAAQAANLTRMLRGVQASQDYQAMQQDLLLRPALLTPAQIHSRMREEIDRYAGLVKTYGLGPIG
ncbi:tripartite tricarboxylate transporter substrate-binding protein [Pseudomonas sp. NPDC007930]|uniref:Bug family tripartite tricarboxylate transporter substrate binding protein n=1 Tax=Pseudomonas sp. NPDC007930 TaxID=3364417 RepID=UPI0036E35E07